MFERLLYECHFTGRIQIKICVYSASFIPLIREENKNNQILKKT